MNKCLTDMDQNFIDEKRKILKDLLYVALTRAISELHVVGQDVILVAGRNKNDML